MRRIAVFSLLVCGAIGTASAQNDRTISFDVASIRLSAPGKGLSQRITDTRLDLVNVPLRQVLWIAFRIDPPRSERLSAPNWTQDRRVDIHAIIREGRRESVPEMLQQLLIERFGLRTSVKPRLTDLYELVVGSGGIRMVEVQAANELDKKLQTHPSIQNADVVFNELDGAVRVTRTPRGMRTTTDRSTYERIFITGRQAMQLDATRITMKEFASLLTTNVGRPVFDKTGLPGLYRFQVELPLDASASRILASRGITKTADGQPLDNPTGLSVSNAVEQLGLRLVPRRIPLDTVVVDSLNKVPTGN